MVLQRGVAKCPPLFGIGRLLCGEVVFYYKNGVRAGLIYTKFYLCSHSTPHYMSSADSKPKACDSLRKLAKSRRSFDRLRAKPRGAAPMGSRLKSCCLFHLCPQDTTSLAQKRNIILSAAKTSLRRKAHIICPKGNFSPSRRRGRRVPVYGGKKAVRMFVFGLLKAENPRKSGRTRGRGIGRGAGENFYLCSHRIFKIKNDFSAEKSTESKKIIFCHSKK